MLAGCTENTPRPQVVPPNGILAHQSPRSCEYDQNTSGKRASPGRNLPGPDADFDPAVRLPCSDLETSEAIDTYSVQRWYCFPTETDNGESIINLHCPHVNIASQDGDDVRPCRFSHAECSTLSVAPTGLPEPLDHAHDWRIVTSLRPSPLSVRTPAPKLPGVSTGVRVRADTLRLAAILQ